MAASQVDEAIIEYRSALEVDQKRGDIWTKLGDAYVEKRDGGNAYRAYIRAADVLPDDAAAQIRAGNFLLMAGQFEDAKTRANNVLDQGCQQRRRPDPARQCPRRLEEFRRGARRVPAGDDAQPDRRSRLFQHRRAPVAAWAEGRGRGELPQSGGGGAQVDRGAHGARELLVVEQPPRRRRRRAEGGARNRPREPHARTGRSARSTWRRDD